MFELIRKTINKLDFTDILEDYMIEPLSKETRSEFIYTPVALMTSGLLTALSALPTPLSPVLFSTGILISTAALAPHIYKDSKKYLTSGFSSEDKPKIIAKYTSYFVCFKIASPIVSTLSVLGLGYAAYKAFTTPPSFFRPRFTQDLTSPFSALDRKTYKVNGGFCCEYIEQTNSQTYESCGEENFQPGPFNDVGFDEPSWIRKVQNMPSVKL